MKFYTFGSEAKPVLLLLPGTCCHWKLNFWEVIPLIEQDFHVVCVSYDGFDETEDTVFPDMLTETEKIEAYIIEHFNGHIRAAYGVAWVAPLSGCWYSGRWFMLSKLFWAVRIWIRTNRGKQS